MKKFLRTSRMHTKREKWKGILSLTVCEGGLQNFHQEKRSP